MPRGMPTMESMLTLRLPDSRSADTHCRSDELTVICIHALINTAYEGEPTLTLRIEPQDPLRNVAAALTQWIAVRHGAPLQGVRT
ncbi:hypothetical protein [Pusillimonas sp.]|uniref:hypothetical protein n=1 Tax=Pusillimonas sp. TaxID=3040095 RepID=UPI0029BF2E83|nr:hypothetical protein [Pusillimonas sp.]MDX3894411.1 hypothetical protein [Pusillimonas sp.]